MTVNIYGMTVDVIRSQSTRRGGGHGKGDREAVYYYTYINDR